MTFHASTLRHRVTIQALQQTRNEWGEFVTDWVDVARVWADVRPLSGREFIASQQVQSKVTARITIRYRAGIAASQRVLQRDTTYNIEAVLPDPEMGREYLTLMCSTGAAS